MFQRFSGFHIGLVLAAAAVFVTAGIISAQQPGQEDAVRSAANQLLTAIDQEEVADAVGKLSADAKIDGFGFCPGDACTGNDSIRSTLELAAEEDLRVEIVQGMERVQGKVWISEVELRAKSISQAGAQRLLYQLEIEVDNGKVTRLRFTPELDDEQTAKFIGTSSPASVPRPVQPPSTGTGGMMGH